MKKRTIYHPNEIEICEGYALVYLYDRQCNVKAKTLIDIEDIPKISEYKWRFGNNVYVDNAKVGFLHKFVLNTKEEVDHINRNKLDNRKINLRKCSHVQNCMNRGKPFTNKSGAKGVSFKKREGRYEAYLNVNKKFISLGTFKCVIEAAEAYNKAALKHQGEFAVLNNIEELKMKQAVNQHGL